MPAGRASGNRHNPSAGQRIPADFELTRWLKILAIGVLVWLILERLAEYLTHVGFAVTIGVGGLFIAYLFYPLIRKFNERVPLWAAVLAVYAAFTVAMMLLLSYVVPIIVEQFQRFVAALPQLERQTAAQIAGPNVPFVSRLPPSVHHYIENIPTQFGTFVQSAAMNWSGVLDVLLSMLSLVALLLIMPIVSIYMLSEAESIKRTFLGMLPARHRDRAKSILSQLDEVFGGFVRGQLIVAVAVGTLVTLLLLLLHLPYALLIGAWAGALEIVPYLGAIAGAVPGVLVALATDGVTTAALTALGFAAIYQLDGSLIAPNVSSRMARISPLTTIFALLVGGELFGIVGMIVAVPVAGAIRVLIDNVRPPEELTVAEVEPGLTKVAQNDVHPHAIGSDVSKTDVERAVAQVRKS